MDTLYESSARHPTHTPALLRGIEIDPRMARFPRLLSGLDDLNPVLAAAFKKSLGAGEVVRQVVYAPGQRILHHRGQGLWSRINALLGWEVSPGWVIVATSECLHLAAIPAGGDPGPVQHIPFETIVAMEIGSILLNSWVEWTWVGKSQIERARVHFNNVGQRLFLQVMALVRSHPLPRAEAPPPRTDRGLEKLLPLPFKFRTLISCDLLMPEEQVRAAAFRPAFLDTFWRSAPAVVFAITDRSLIVVEEESPKAVSGWGLTARYYPAHTIDKAEITAANHGFLLEVEQTTPFGPHEFRVPFEQSSEPAFRQLVESFPSGGGLREADRSRG